MSSERLLSPAPRRQTVLYWILGAAAIAGGVVHASSLAFLNDDAFISFRYAKNLVRGLGLVYNAGERVEGYTNFLWTLIIAGGMKLGITPESISIVLGILFYSLTLGLFTLLGWKLRGITAAHRLLIPLTPIALCLHRDFNAYATSGLETAMFTFLVSALYATLLLGNSRWSPAFSGIIGVLAMMTRPDGVLFLLASVIYLSIVKRKPVGPIFRFLLPSVVLFVPYWLWRWSTYGYFFPNSFYAKSIDLPYYRQGLEYTILYFKTYYVFLLLIPLGATAIWMWMKQAPGSGVLTRLRGRLRASEHHPLILAAPFVGIYSLFVIRIGGDFMFARFFIPLTPVLFHALETLIASIGTRPWGIALQIAVLGATLFRADQFAQHVSVGYVTDEARYYTAEHLKESKVDGLALRKYFDNLPVRVGFWAGQAKLMYYADPAYAIECSAGLTDPAIAHESIHERGRPGHEKSIPISYLMSRGIHFLFGPMEPPPPGQAVVNAIVFNYMLAKIVVYDDSIMSRLAQFPEVQFVRCPEYLDSYLKQIDGFALQRVLQDYAFFKAFYFDHNADSLRQNKFAAALSRIQGRLNGK